MIESHVTSLELSKRLKDLGVKQESEFYWDLRNIPKVVANQTFESETFYGKSMASYSAFLSSELGELLPNTVIYENYFTRIYITRPNAKWNIEFLPYADRKAIGFQDENEADARAKMLIYLIEQGLVKP